MMNNHLEEDKKESWKTIKCSVNRLSNLRQLWKSISISESVVVRRRAGLKNETIDSLCFLNGFLTQEK